MKILNLYAGIGGNRKLWGNNHDITAVEINPRFASVYKDHFPDDEIIVGDAHAWLLNHYKEYKFIWSSPPCPTHSSFAVVSANSDCERTGNAKRSAVYPEMSLYQEIIFLRHFCKSKWVVENVIPYYEPLIKGQKIQRHLFWSNFIISQANIEADNIKEGIIGDMEKNLGFDLSNYAGLEKRKVLRNCVQPELGKHIFNCAFKEVQSTLI